MENNENVNATNAAPETLEAVPPGAIARLYLTALEVTVLTSALKALKREIWTSKESYPMEADFAAGDILKQLMPIEREIHRAFEQEAQKAGSQGVGLQSGGEKEAAGQEGPGALDNAA